MKIPKEKWEEEFDRVFVIGGNQPYYFALKSFIHSLLSQARLDLIEEIEFEIGKDKYWVNRYRDVFLIEKFESILRKFKSRLK